MIIKPVVSKRIKDLVELLLPNRIHWVPAEIDTDKKVYYFFIMVTSEINCLDHETSKLHLQSDGQIFEVQEMVLDPEKLKTHFYEYRGIFWFTTGNILFDRETNHFCNSIIKSARSSIYTTCSKTAFH